MVRVLLVEGPLVENQWVRVPDPSGARPKRARYFKLGGCGLSPKGWLKVLGGCWEKFEGSLVEILLVDGPLVQGFLGIAQALKNSWLRFSGTG